VDELVVFPRRHPSRWPAQFLALRGRSDPVTIDFQGTLKSRLQLSALRSPRKIGFAAGVAREGAEQALTERSAAPGRVIGFRRTGAARALARRFSSSPRPPLAVPAEARERAADFIARLRGEGPVVVLHPGTSAFGEFKRWPPDRVAALGDRLAARRGARLVLTGGPGEQALVDAVRSTLRARAAVAVATGLHELSALLAAAELVVAADSLPLHLANFHGTPVVGLYGPGPARTPFFDRSRVVRAWPGLCTPRRCSDRIA
jgi:ADP-heptose:LPS heptosyltransferase